MGTAMKAGTAIMAVMTSTATGTMAIAGVATAGNITDRSARVDDAGKLALATLP
jgi:hypothetical protein